MIRVHPDASRSCENGLGEKYFNTIENIKDEIIQADYFTGTTETAGVIKNNGIKWAMELRRKKITEENSILLCSRPSNDDAAIILGILFVGARIVSIDAETEVEELNYILEIVDPILIFCDKRVAINIERTRRDRPQHQMYIIGKGSTIVNTVYKQEIDPDFTPAIIRDPKTTTALVAVTEGVTDIPKIVKLSHEAVFTRCEVFLNMITTEKVKKVISYFASTGTNQFLLILASFEKSFVRVIPRPFVERDVCKVIHDVSIEFAMFSTDKAAKVANYYRKYKDHNLSCLRIILLGGGPTSQRNMQTIMNIFEAKTVAVYGTVEAGIITSVSQGDDANEELKKPGYIGKVLPGVRVKIVDFRHDKLVEPNVWGELVCSAPVMCSGYINGPQDKHYLEGNYCKTGDVAQYDSNGCIYVRGRLDEIFISKGHVFFALDIEEVLDTHPEVVESACLSDGKQILLYCVLSSTKTTIKSLFVFLSEKLPKYMAPHKIYVLNELPRTRNGKVKKYLLKQFMHRRSITHY